MIQEKIIVRAFVSANLQKVWDFYTLPEHITKWNFADPSWHCPTATNDLKVGGRYVARMEAKDGSFGFEFDAMSFSLILIYRYPINKSRHAISVSATK